MLSACRLPDDGQRIAPGRHVAAVVLPQITHPVQHPAHALEVVRAACGRHDTIKLQLGSQRREICRPRVTEAKFRRSSRGGIEVQWVSVSHERRPKACEARWKTSARRTNQVSPWPGSMSK